MIEGSRVISKFQVWAAGLVRLPFSKDSKHRKLKYLCMDVVGRGYHELNFEHFEVV